MQPQIILCLTLVLSGGLAVVRADMVPGVDWHVANAEVIEVVQAEMPSAAEAFPSPRGKQRVWVKEVLKGLDSQQEFLLPKGTLKPGQTAVVLYEYNPEGRSEPALQTSPGAQPAMSVWPINSTGKVDTHGILPQEESGFLLNPDTEGINLELIRKDIATSSPEEVGLYAQVVDALLLPEMPTEFRAVTFLGGSRTTYVRFVIAIRDLNRDVPWFARLLESRDQRIRAAALKKLEALTGIKNPEPRDKNPRSLQDWAQTWAQQPVSTQARQWPPVPGDLKTPPDAFPAPLIQALERDDADAFAKALAKWLDSGVMRDRELRYAETLDRKIVYGSNLSGSGPYLPPAPRLREDVVLDTNIPAIDRMKAIALLSQILHYDRFAQERAKAIVVVASAPRDSDILRRAAFWEMRDVDFQTAGREALNRLAQSGEDEFSQRFLLGLCLSKLDSAAEDAVRVEIKVGRQTFMKGLFACLATPHDSNAKWIARLLCQEGQKQVIPVMLTWLKDKDSEVRKTGAFNLCWLPSADTVSDLLDAIQDESDRDVKGQMLVALAQTGDQRGLGTLLVAAREPYDSEVMAEITRGLGRIRDPKALRTLADIVSGLAWITNGDVQLEKSNAPPGYWNLLSDSVNAFGYISHVYEAHNVDSFWSSSPINPAQLKVNMARIEEWRKAQGNKP